MIYPGNIENIISIIKKRYYKNKGGLVTMANKKITLHEFIEKYVARNTLCRLWKPLKTGSKMMILKEPIME